MKILIVDDQRSNVQLIEMMLEDQGYETCSAENGLVACEKFSADTTIKIVLMDVYMPVMDGMSAARKMKAHHDRHVAIIFVTALDNVDMLSQCLNAGGDDFVPKPVDENILIAKIKAHQRTNNTYYKLMEANQQLLYHRNVMNHELKIVEHVFKNGLSRFENKFENVLFHSSPMSMFNGDLLLIEKSRLGSTYFILGDFTGHGLAAAIGCLPVSDVFQAMAIKHRSVGEIAREINRRLLRLLPDNMFFCAVIIELNPTAERMSIWMGGMHELMVFDGNGQFLQQIESAHMPLGVLNDDEFDDAEQIFLPPVGSYIFGYTDGIVETVDSAGNMFGTERLKSTFQSGLCADTPISSLDYVIEALYHFQESEAQDDDLSLLSIHCCPTETVLKNSDSRSGKSTVLAESSQPFPWVMNVALGPEQLADKQIVHNIVNVIVAVESCKDQAQTIFFIVSELVNNAIEHGILGLSSRMKDTPEGFQNYFVLREEKLKTLSSGGISVHCEIIQSPTPKLMITITDTGHGFNYQQLAAVDDAASHGRGLAFIAELAESLEYTDGGRSATAVVNL